MKTTERSSVWYIQTIAEIVISRCRAIYRQREMFVVQFIFSMVFGDTKLQMNQKQVSRFFCILKFYVMFERFNDNSVF